MRDIRERNLFDQNGQFIRICRLLRREIRGGLLMKRDTALIGNHREEQANDLSRETNPMLGNIFT